jgi:hypothetical protein
VLAALLEQTPAGVRAALPQVYRSSSSWRGGCSVDRPRRRAAPKALDGLAEGVVLWDDGGRPLLANWASRKCGAHRQAGEVAGGAIERAGRQLEVEIGRSPRASVGLIAT